MSAPKKKQDPAPKTQAAPAQMPSSEISPANAIQRVRECHQYMVLQQWSQFRFLYPRLAAFQDARVKSTRHPVKDDDEFTIAWNKLRLYAVDSILKNLDGSRKFEDFLDWAQRLSEIISDQRTLWNVLHCELQPCLKVTLE